MEPKAESPNERTIVHVCGIPGSGKTTYCKWLEQEKHFLHLDFDHLLSGIGTQVKLSLIRPLLEGHTKNFIAKLSERHQSTVIDWGFPVTNLPVVQQLQREGVSIWWFDGDRPAARQAFARRATVSLADFDRQMKSIEKQWTEIEQLIGDHVIGTVKMGPAHAKPDWIFEQMFSGV